MVETIRTAGILLRHYPVGENHRNIVLLSRERGLLSATVYGAQGRKSRLRPLVFPFHRVEGDFTYDAVRDRWRVKDLTSSCAFEGVRGEVERYYTASLWAEVLMKSLAKGEPRPVLFDLLNRGLQVLEKVPARQVRGISFPFLWAYLAEEGVQPDIDFCGRCGKPAGTGSLYWIDREEAFLCIRCAGAASGIPGASGSPAASGSQGQLALSPGARRYLAALPERSLEQSVSLSLDAASGRALGRILYHILQAQLESPLKALRSGFV